MSLSINQVVNAQIMPQAVAAQRRDLSMITAILFYYRSQTRLISILILIQ
ncbi:hypothetical protein PTE_03114 [Photorhabdus khanii NC19]|uniref:Uncharacterized protein n=1 Tax=Photorhabdus khanii NC19 TaxID=1004151 RepID=W3V7S8_9GAMM|nr:hypothetical protein [Photorhabdus khanii]ETS31160.1 hypothetical protein PTE_03114 [Photorhabdus khanii NC19]